MPNPYSGSIHTPAKFHHMHPGTNFGTISGMPAQPTTAKTKRVKELSAHLPPKPLAVRDFWRKWAACCSRNFSDASAELQCIAQLKEDLAADPMFVQLNEGLEQLLLNNRGHDIELTSKAWLALTLVVMQAAYAESIRRDATPARKDETRKATIAALEKARMLFVLSQGAPIGGVSIQDWIEKGPWNNDAQLWISLFRHGLHLVTPDKEPLYYALRQYWLQLASIGSDIPLSIAMDSAPDATGWCLPRPMTLANIQNVFRSGRRWSVRAKNRLNDALAACETAPEWTGVYLFSLWLHRMDDANPSPIGPEELTLLGQCMTPDDMAYWLVLAHDWAHHKGQHRAVLDALEDFNLEGDAHYPEASNILLGLQMFTPLNEIELACAAWTRWQEIQEQETVALPDLV